MTPLAMRSQCEIVEVAISCGVKMQLEMSRRLQRESMLCRGCHATLGEKGDW